ncbi:MAG TPA: hypothetical protein VMV39_06185, partial [Terracidiphilus sp.]|nr:hypothetical protein [Terracidiphilus sp.]
NRVLFSFGFGCPVWVKGERSLWPKVQPTERYNVQDAGEVANLDPTTAGSLAGIQKKVNSMKKSMIVPILMPALLAVLVAGTAWSQQKCDGSDIANGPFTYAALGVTSATFTGSGGSPVTTSFSVTAPSPTSDTDLPNVFPGQGQNPCVGQADASILALEVQKVGDATGNPITPVNLDVSTGLGAQIAAAFVLNPNTYTFVPGGSVTVSVTVSNPGLDSANYGDYAVKLAAQAPGAGIGVGSGIQFTLSLRTSTVTDTTPPTVTVTKPASDQILGVIDVEVQAVDPVGSPAVGTGVVSVSATVSSAGGAVSSQAISLAFIPSLPVVAGVTVTGTGSFTPIGGTGAAGTTDAEAFSSGAPSGIGSYTINAQATDGAGNTGYGSKSFSVKYNTVFTKAFAPGPCATKTGSSGDNCSGQFQFTVNRSNITSDGAFMFDHTVVVKLLDSSDNVVATHAYGTGAISANVQIDATVPVYQTTFVRSDIGASNPATYKAEVYFVNVDGSLMLQATSTSVTF